LIVAICHLPGASSTMEAPRRPHINPRSPASMRLETAQWSR